MQKKFTSCWNIKHRHTQECLSRQEVQESDTGELICLINSDDLENGVVSNDPNADINTCICPETIRPYKARGAVWSLQKAIQYSFNQALDK